MISTFTGIVGGQITQPPDLSLAATVVKSDLTDSPWGSFDLNTCKSVPLN